MKFKLGKNFEFEILGKKSMQENNLNQDFVNKSMDEINMTWGNQRPMMDHLMSAGGDIVRIPYYPLNMRSLFDLAIYSDLLRTIINAKRRETFRQGYEIEEKFAKKCRECGKEFEYPEDECDECGSKELRDPDAQQKKRLENFLPNVNDNHQDILMVSGEVNDDIETIDDGYMLMTKDYYFDDKGDLAGQVPVELLRAHPINIRIIADKTGRPGRDMDGKIVWTCVDHRDDFYQDITRCPSCKKQLFPAHFRAETFDGQYIYYIKGEVYHRSLYYPSLTYGFSAIIGCWLKVTTLMSMDYYMNKYYTKQRPPRGILYVNTPNMESLEKSWNWMLDQFKKNPHQIPPLAIENPQGHGGKMVEFVDFMRTLDEMQYIESRQEMRRVVGAQFGVMPLFQADLSTGGGLNNEGLEITITNRAVEDEQKIYNEGFYPWITEQLGVTDYKIILKPSEEEDEMHEIELENAKMRNAAMMQQMGYEVTLNEEGEFEFEPTEEPVTPMGGGMDGGGLFPGSSPFSKIPSSSGTQGPTSAQQRFTGEPESVRRSIEKSVKKISTGKIQLRRREKLNVITERLSGEIEKIKVDIDDKSSEINIVMTTPDGEEILNVVTNKSDIYYPRNWNVANQKMTGVSMQGFGQSNPSEKYFCDGNLNIILEGSGPKDVINDIEIIVREHSFNERPVLLSKSEGPANTSTPGVNNPMYGRRKRNIRTLVSKEIKKVSKEIGKEISIMKAEENIEEMADFIEDSLYSKKFTGMSKSLSNRIKDRIIKAIINGEDMNKVIKYIGRTGGKKINMGNASLIARTEMQALQNKAREWAFKSFDPHEEFKYRWLNPNDHRTTQTCKNILKRTANGVSMDQLRKVVEEESNKAKGRGELPSNYQNRDYTPHFQCRSTFIRSM